MRRILWLHRLTKPYHDGFEVIGAFNAGVAEYNGEVLPLPCSGAPH